MSGQRSRQGTRKAGLKPGRPLARKSEMPRGKPLARAAWKRTPNPGAAGSSLGVRAEPKRPRDTGPSRKVRGLVLARDNFQCVACGKPVGGACTWWSIQHRIARGQGGTNDLSNLIALCGSAVTGCHGRCEQRDREMQARGYWLEGWQDPRLEPVMVCDQDGGVTVWLTADGQYSLSAPAGEPG